MFLRGNFFLTIIFFCFIFYTKAQINIVSPFYSDSFESSYYLNYGISLCNSENGNYEKALQFLENKNLKKNLKNQYYLRYLIDYQTKVKKKTHQIIDLSQLNEKEKAILKLWLFAVTKNDDDYIIALKNIQNKYSNDIDVKKIDIRKVLQDRYELIFTDANFKSISDTIENILTKNHLSKEDKLYFKLLQLDCDEYFYRDKNKTELEREKILSKYSALWNENKPSFSDKYAKINFKIKSKNSNQYFQLTNENTPDDHIFDEYITFLYGQPIQDLAGNDNKKYIDYIKKNPFYYGESEGGFNLDTVDWNKSPKKVENKEQFREFIKNINHVITEFPRAKGPKMTYLDALITNKNYVYNNDSEIYQTQYLKNIIDIFALDQRADFENHFNYFRDILEKDSSEIKFNDYYKIFLKQVKNKNEQEILDYLNIVEKEFPNNKNIKLFLKEFSQV